MRTFSVLLLVVSAAVAACDSAGQTNGGQLTQDPDASGADGLVSDGTTTTTTTPTTTTTTTTGPDATTPADTLVPPGDSHAPIDTGTPGDSASATDTGTPSDTVVTPGGGAVGAACGGNGDCAGGARATCLGLPGGYCALGDCDTAGCPDGASCWGFGDSGSFCIQDCTSPSQCRTGECSSDRDCVSETTAALLVA